MRLIPRASKVRITFYKGITIPDVAIGLAALALFAVTISTNFSWRWYAGIGIVCAVVPLFLNIGDERLYVGLAHMVRYVFSKKAYSGDSVSEILPCHSVRDDVVVNRDGSLFGAIEIEPVNFHLFDEKKQGQLIDGCVSPALSGLGDGEEWFLIKLDRQLVLDGEMSGELERLNAIAKEKEAGRMSEAEYSSRADLIEGRMRIIDGLNSGERKHPRFYLALEGSDEGVIDERLAKAESLLSSNGMRAVRLGRQELFQLIKGGYGLDADPREEAAVAYEPKEIHFGVSSTRQDDVSISHFAITRYPLMVPDAWGERLFSIPNAKVVMRMRPVERSKAVRRIDNAILEIQTKNVGKESQQLEDESHLDSLRELLSDIQQDDETLFDTVCIVSVYDALRSSDNRKYAKSQLREMGFGFAEMLGRQKEAYVSSLISSKELTGCARGIQTSSLAACFPFVSDTHDDGKGLYVGESDDPTFIDFFRRDEMHVNSNVVVIGQSGSGKSYATKSILSGLASGGAKVYVIDPESEYGKLAQSLGGRRVDASGGANGIINPFQISMEMEGDDGTSSNAFYSQLQFIERFYRLTLSGISPDALELLNKLTVECYKAKGIGGDSDLRKLKPGDYPTFDDLCGLSDSRLSDSGDGYEKGCLLAIVNYLARFARGGRDSSLWDGPTSFSPKENFIAFDFQRLLANKNESTANAEMLLILRYIEGEVIANRERNAKEGTKRKVVVAIDEAHLFIDEKYPVALDFMYSLAKRIRKYDGMLMIITQNVRDFAGTPDIARKSSAIVSVSQYSMIFSLPPNDMNDLVGLYANSGGLSEEEKGLVSMSPRGTCFLISGPGERGFLSVIASKEAERKFEP